MRLLINTLLCLSLSLMAVSCTKKKTVSVDTLLTNAVAQGERGDWDKVVQTMQKALKIEPDNVNALVLHGIALEHVGQTQLAFEEMRKAAASSPESFMAQFSLGKMLYESKHYEDCVAPLNTAVRLKPDNPDALLLLARSSEILKLPDATKLFVELAKSARYRNSPDPYNELGVIFAERKKNRSAAKCFIKAYGCAPENPIVVLNLGVFCDVNLKKPATAMKYYTEYLKITEQNNELELKREKVRRRIRTLEQ